MSKFEEAVKRIQNISMIMAFGCALGLYILSKRQQYFDWLAASVVPWFGYPLLALLLLSSVFGGYGVILFILDKYKDIQSMVKDLKELKKKSDDA